MKRSVLSSVAIGALMAAGSAQMAAAQLKDEIIVTATKRSESAQDIPVTVSALDNSTLEELGVDVFTDYLVQLPGVTSGGNGPGQNTIYIRGLASTTPANTIAGVAGLAPNVALYLDEQPVSQPGRNLDVYAADLERVEVLSGPQGTLFGASSQAGTVRLITNKPKLGVFEAISNFGVSFTEGGEMSEKIEAIINVPVSDKFALRGVFYNDNQGGYIDNVLGTRTTLGGGTTGTPITGRFRPQGTVRANGVPVGAGRAGFWSGADLSGVTFLTDTNDEFAEDNFNDTSYTGFRASALYEFNSDWKATVQVGRQELETDGTFFTDPTLNDYEIERFTPDNLEDDYTNVSYTVEGRLGALEALYTGAYTDRDTNQIADYTDYSFVAQYLPYYVCDGSVSYPGTAAPSGTCQPPTSQTVSVSNTEVFTQELRFNTPAEKRLRATAGGFYSKLTLKERNDFQYLGSTAPGTAFGATAVDNYAQPSPSFATDRGAFPDATVFRNDIRRTDEQFGFFGEGTFDVSEKLSLTIGARYYDIDVDLEGSANATFCNSSGVDENAFGTNISDQYDGDGSYTFIGSCDDPLRQTFTAGQSVQDILDAGLAVDPNGYTDAQAQQIFNALSAPDTASTSGVIFKGTASYKPNSDLLFYATYSEGFRPGLLNRPGGAVQTGTGGNVTFTVPFEVDTDEVRNYELGWKTTLAGNQLRFNGNVFYVDISDLQTTIFDPSITNLFFSDNAADARIYGLEADFQYAPDAIQGLTINGAVSLLDTEITRVITPTNDVLQGAELAFAPNFQGNLTARYTWDLSTEYEAHVQANAVYSAEQTTDIVEINRDTLDSYFLLGTSAGIAKDNWTAELFVNNLTNDVAATSGFFNFDVQRHVVARPRTYGARFSVRFD